MLDKEVGKGVLLCFVVVAVATVVLFLDKLLHDVPWNHRQGMHLELSNMSLIHVPFSCSCYI